MRGLISLCVVACGTMSIAAEPPDLIVHHAQVVTVDARFSMAEAIAVKGDRLIAVGSNAEVQSLAGPNTQLIDAGGKCLIPGLCDSHVHSTGAALYEFDHPIPEMDTVADVLAYVARRADELEDGQWINISQVFITRLRDQRYPTRKELDSVAPKNPVAFRTLTMPDWRKNASESRSVSCCRPRANRAASRNALYAAAGISSF